MTTAELDWLDKYHGEIRELLMPRVLESTRPWLEAATAPIDRK